MDRCNQCGKPYTGNNAGNLCSFCDCVNQENLSTVVQSQPSNLSSTSGIQRRVQQIALKSIKSGVASFSDAGTSNSVDDPEKTLSPPHGHGNSSDVHLPSLRNSNSPISAVNGKTSLLERNAMMLFNEAMADVHFLLRESQNSEIAERIPAHSYILSIGSSVFHSMFNGGFRSEQEIDISDVDPYAFRVLLRYLYTDQIELSMDIVIPVLYAAKKYLITHLIQVCLTFIEGNLTANNVCFVLGDRHLFDDSPLMQRCWELVDAQAELAVASSYFELLDKECLVEILSRDTLNARESVIFKAVDSWAEMECERQGLKIDGDNKRAVLGEALNLIRIPTMSISDFADGPAQSGILSCEETKEIFLYYTATTAKPEISFSTALRGGLKVHKCSRFQSAAFRSNQWRYRGRCDAIQFSTDRRVFLTALGLYGSSKPSSLEHAAHIEMKRGGDTLTRRTAKFRTDGTSKVFGLHFDQPIKVEPGEWYTVSASFDGLELSYFGQEGQPEVAARCRDDLVVNFSFQCSSDSTNGTGIHGGQIPELWFYV